MSEYCEYSAAALRAQNGRNSLRNGKSYSSPPADKWARQGGGKGVRKVGSQGGRWKGRGGGNGWGGERGGGKEKRLGEERRDEGWKRLGEE